ncbi:acyl-CoA N-acyltransferase [Sporormia fimetaria CBS 119925]|uniref:Acyl-CoA N-acyltransferase n=1 Tax=Sporormia fimetaria CBS 119925 TaxID=1340428 RepID=A0A6A6VGQ3_9PLEO|nr:acyl-CoA N-acyltransferase [Sporormia fimetaria CBS 119925]
MPLELHPMTDDDIPHFQRIMRAAFRFGIVAALFPKAPTPEESQKDVERLTKENQEDPTVHFLKVIDTEKNNEIIACAKWHIYEKELSEEDVEKRNKKIPDDASLAYRDFFGFLNESRKKWMGTKPFCFLNILVTHPDHHRRGAGAMLVKWGTDRADKAHLPAFLEASEEGKPLYAKMGFKEMEYREFDLTKYGREGTERNTIMIRSPAEPQQ